AEDGIRARTVTGVQTCALPIWGSACRLEKSMAWDLQLAACRAGKLARNARPTRSQPGAPNQTKTGIVEAPDPREDPDPLAKQWEIGRASCRERAKRAERGRLEE